MAHWRRPRSMAVPVREKRSQTPGTFLLALAGLVSGAWLWSARQQPCIDRETKARLEARKPQDGRQ